MFTLLIFLKSFHWLAEDRVDFMERSPSISLLFHVRVLSLACLLASVDCLFISHAYHSTLTKGKKRYIGSVLHTVFMIGKKIYIICNVILQERRYSWYLASSTPFYLQSSSTLWLNMFCIVLISIVRIHGKPRLYSCYMPSLL